MEKYINIKVSLYYMETIKVAIYSKIDSNVKNQATLYATKCKLLNKDTKTLSLLMEEALSSYMINNPL